MQHLPHPPVRLCFRTAFPEERCFPSTKPLLELARTGLQHDANRFFQETKEPATADLIIYLEPNYIKDEDYLRRFCRDDVLRSHREKCYVIDPAATFWAFLPGAYTALPRSKAKSDRFVSCGYFDVYNREVERVGKELSAAEHLFSFMGSCSHHVRRRLFETSLNSDATPVVESSGWFDHSREQKEVYSRQLVKSAFVLCPRGLSPSTIRCYETMQVGRVPVIISDEWVPPLGPAWEQFSIRIAEDNVDSIPEVVRRFEPCAEEMGRKARLAWEQWFAPEIAYLRLFEQIFAMHLRRSRASRMAPVERMGSFRQRWRVGWTFPQKVAKTIRHGTFWSRVSHRLRGAS